MAKASKMDMIRREKRIMDLMEEGADRNTIFETVAKEEKISPRTVETQYLHIVKKLDKLLDENRSELKANLMARQEAIYKKALKVGALKVALDSTTAQAKLGGLFENIETEKERPKTIVFKEKDMSGKLAVVPETGKVENDK